MHLLTVKSCSFTVSAKRNAQNTGAPDDNTFLASTEHFFNEAAKLLPEIPQNILDVIR